MVAENIGERGTAAPGRPGGMGRTEGRMGQVWGEKREGGHGEMQCRWRARKGGEFPSLLIPAEERTTCGGDAKMPEIRK
jgi:hypothetical protein